MNARDERDEAELPLWKRMEERGMTREGGWKRQCPACEAEHLPRTDPVVIMVAVHGERCMVGRQERSGDWQTTRVGR